MLNSVWDTEVQITLDQANKPEARLVSVGNRTVEVLTPFPSPIDWRDIWIYFMMVDRFNNPAAPPHHQPWDQPWGPFPKLSEPACYGRKKGWDNPYLLELVRGDAQGETRITNRR